MMKPRMTAVTLFVHLLLLLLLVLSLIPVLSAIGMSLKPTVRIYGDYWGLPWPPVLANYRRAIGYLAMPIVRTLVLSVGSIVGIQVFATMSAYAFARLEFPGREALFYGILALMMVPGVLVLTPNFLLASRLGLRDSLFGLGVFYVAGGQVFAVFLLRAFFQEQPRDVFESARLDGASELRCLWSIAVPMSVPVLITVGIMEFLAIYDDLLWPLLMISSLQKQTVIMAIQSYAPVADMFSSTPDLGAQTAGYIVASLPIVLVFVLGMKHYVAGITSGALKG